MPGAITVPLDATASPSHAVSAASPALTASLAIMVIAAVTLAGAWFFQLVLRSEEHTSELQSQSNLVCRLLLEKKKLTAARHRRRMALRLEHLSKRIRGGDY